MRWIGAVVFFTSIVCAEETEKWDDTYHYITRPDIQALRWTIETFDEQALQQGHYWFLAPYLDINQSEYPKWNGPQIYRPNGDLVWSGAPLLRYSNTYDFKMSEINGEPMLSLIADSEGSNGYVLDNSYQLRTTVHMSTDTTNDTGRANMHELNIIDHGKHALFMKRSESDVAVVNNSKYNGTCQILYQAMRETDLETGEVIFEWDSHEHIPLPDLDSRAHWAMKCSSTWDVTHMNSLDKFNDGDYLVSLRNMHTIYKISHKDHSIVWRLGGPSSDFHFKDQQAEFSHQHHARLRSQNESHILLSLFDNANGVIGSDSPYSNTASCGLLLSLRIDIQPMTVELVVQFQKPLIEYAENYTRTRGSMQLLPNGNAFIGWVDGSHISEHAPNGTTLMTAISRTNKAASYRSYKFPWIGRPAQPPDVVATARQIARSNHKSTTDVYISWNGATEVATWKLLRTNKRGNISALAASSPIQGFETKIILDGVVQYVMAVGISQAGQELGRSGVITVDIPASLQTTFFKNSEQEWLNRHSSSWWTPQAAQGRIKTNLIWLAVGSLCIVLLACAGIWFCVRWLRKGQGKSWWSAQRTQYERVNDDDDDDDCEPVDATSECDNEKVDNTSVDKPYERHGSKDEVRTPD